jgi:hypothetical protein
MKVSDKEFREIIYFVFREIFICFQDFVSKNVKNFRKLKLNFVFPIRQEENLDC